MTKKLAKKDDSAPIDALRLMLRKTHSVKLAPVVNQVSALPVDDQLEYYFVPMEFMHLYEPYHRPGKPYKNLKLINYERPAISLSFFSKHKYSIRRSVSQDEVLLHLKNRRNELLDRSTILPLTANQQQELQQADQLMRNMRDEPELYQVCFSNYHHYYKYWYCTYRYFDDLASMKTSTVSEHMLKYTERVEDKVNERMNIIFIDPKYISRPVPYANDNKLVDRELDTYPIQIKQGVTTLYIRKAD